MQMEKMVGEIAQKAKGMSKVQDSVKLQQLINCCNHDRSAAERKCNTDYLIQLLLSDTSFQLLVQISVLRVMVAIGASTT